MTNEEMQKTMQFILEQQAQFTVDIQKLQESQAQSEQLINRLAAVTVRGFEETNAKINALVDSQVRLIDSQAKTDETTAGINAKINALADSQIRLTEAQAKTDEGLRKLMSVVDRYFSEGRNGK